MNVSDVTFSSQTVKRDWRGETLMFLVDLGRGTISIFPAFPLQGVGRLAYTVRQRAGRPYGKNCVFRIIFIFVRLFLFLLCLYCYSILLTIILFASRPFLVVRLLVSLKRVLLDNISLFIVRV